jgi:hypothetical protein
MPESTHVTLVQQLTTGMGTVLPTRPTTENKEVEGKIIEQTKSFIESYFDSTLEIAVVRME